MEISTFHKATPRMRLSRRLAAWALALAGALPLAATQTVTNTNDSSAGSLRQAMIDANATGDTIQFAPGVTGTITLSSTLTIDKNLTINGPGASQLAVSGNNSVGAFAISSGVTAAISGLTIENGNEANIYQGGSGIFNVGTLTLTNSTVAGNAATYGGTLTLKSTLLASNTGGNCFFAGSTVSQDYNLSDDNSCAPAFTAKSDQNNVVARLASATPQNNGGPTPTIALLPTSPAVDAIPVANCTDTSGKAVATDQRGIKRPQGAGCDIGAFELVQTVPLSAFTAQLELLTGKVSGFNLDARFTLGSNSQGISPVTEAVTLTVGSYSVTLPAGSFQQVQIGPFSDYTYGGTVNKVGLDVQILPLGGNSYALQATAVPVTLTGATNSVPVTLTLGQDTGTTTVTPIILRK